jgi:hypothetical protein
MHAYLSVLDDVTIFKEEKSSSIGILITIAAPQFEQNFQSGLISVLQLGERHFSIPLGAFLI